MKNYALQNKYDYQPNHTLILPFISSKIIKKNSYKLSKAVIGHEGDISFTMGFYDIIENEQQMKSLFVINNTHVDLPCFLTKKYSSFSFYFDESTISLIGKKNKRGYRLGDELEVICIGARKEVGEIDFVINNELNKSYLKDSDDRDI